MAGEQNEAPLLPRRPASSYDRRVQVAAAKARVTIDARLGVDTPQWIRELAEEKPQRQPDVQKP